MLKYHTVEGAQLCPVIIAEPSTGGVSVTEGGTERLRRRGSGVLSPNNYVPIFPMSTQVIPQRKAWTVYVYMKVFHIA